MPGDQPEDLPELEAFGLLQLAREVVGSHAMCLVDHDQVPFGAGQLVEQLLVSC